MSYSWPRPLQQVDLPLGSDPCGASAPSDAPDDRPRDLSGAPVEAAPTRRRAPRPRQPSLPLLETAAFKLR